MKPAPAAISALISLVLIAGCTSAPPHTSRPVRHPKPPRTPKDQLPSIESRLSGNWIHAATRLQAADAVIYYQGTAQRDSADGEPWTGTVQGDILFVSRQQAIVMPSGTLTLGKNHSMTMLGLHRTFLASPGENPSWRVLLSM